MAQQSLRNALEEMTKVQDVSQHPRLLSEIALRYPNTVKLLASQHPIERYTCLMHVLDFTEKPEYTAIAGRIGTRSFAGAKFAHWLLDNKLLSEISQENTNEESLAIYFDNDQKFKHIGFVAKNGRILSKWGTGHLFEHGRFEVPDSYGSAVRFFEKLPYDRAYEYFRSFTEQNTDR